MKTQIELNEKWNRINQARRERHRAEDLADFALQQAEQEALNAERVAEQKTEQDEKDLAIEREVDRLRPLNPDSIAKWVTQRERALIRKYLRKQDLGAVDAAAVARWVRQLDKEADARRAREESERCDGVSVSKGQPDKPDYVRVVNDGGRVTESEAKTALDHAIDEA